MNEDFRIPVDDAINDFESHLAANDRTILSSKFGDGKSYFLEAIKASGELSKKYEFLTIYPVNYQVLKNEDIFQLLKRDLLFQMFLHQMIDDDIEFSDKEMLSWFLFYNGKDVLSDLIPTVLNLGLIPEQCTNILLSLKGFSLFKTIRAKFQEFKAKFKTDDDELDSFLSQLDPEYKYEYDPITAIIRNSLKKFRKNGKKVVLVIEDMDRLDPAHLFRIMNVLSAHIDYCYKFAAKPDATLAGNKFDLDKIVIVIDYSNLRNIYKHFYGVRTDFDGYISKFLSSTPFYYSLTEQKIKYATEALGQLTSVPKEILASLLSEEILKSSTIRELIQSFDIDNQLVNVPTVSFEGKDVLLDTSIQKLMAVLRRLKLKDSEIIDKILEIKELDRDYFLAKTCQYLFVSNDADNTPIYITTKDSQYGLIQVETNIQQDGSVRFGQRYSCRNNAKPTDFSQNVQSMLSYVVR